MFMDDLKDFKVKSMTCLTIFKILLKNFKKKFMVDLKNGQVGHEFRF